MPFTDAEQHVRDVIAEREASLVELASALIGFDTTARTPGEAPRAEAPLQEYLAERLRSVGAEIDLFEADADDMRGQPLVPAGLDFAGRPQLIARLPAAAASSGRSLVFNGHIDVVSGEPKDRWTSDPFTAEVRNGRLYGRGACDMKGGVAAMTFAAETIAGLGIRLAGDLTVATNTDEESSGAGGMALVRRGLRADAAIVTEPTNHTTWVACRGSEYGTITVPGRPGHAEVRQPDWRRGGAVNAIEKAIPVLEAMRALRDDWATREGLDHPHVSRPDLLATMARSGEWAVTYPASCDLTIAVMYVMAQADERGWGSKVREEVEARILEATRADEWLAENPPVFRWWDNPVMPLDIDPNLPIVTTMLETTADAGGPAELSGLDSWYDGATLTVFGGFPAIGYGPPGFDQDGTSLAHIIDEYVPVAGLVRCAQDLAVAAMRFCGLAE